MESQTLCKESGKFNELNLIIDDDFCIIMKISKRTSYEWRKSGLKYIKSKKIIYYKKEDIENFLSDLKK
jgi:hypothetical protein